MKVIDMIINRNKRNDELFLELGGKIDTITAPLLEAELKKEINETKFITLDFKNVEYVSSAGLRVLLNIHKLLMKDGKLVLINVNQTIQEVLDMTGFSSILNIVYE